MTFMQAAHLFFAGLGLFGLLVAVGWLVWVRR